MSAASEPALSGKGLDAMDTGDGPWDPQYEQLLRDHLPEAGVGTALSAGDDLYELGLDSFATVELLVALERTFGISFPDDALTAATFTTVGSLWTVLSGVIGRV